MTPQRTYTNSNYDFDVSTFYGGNGEVMKKVTMTRKKEPDGLFFNLIDWTGVNDKANRWGNLAALVYLDGLIQEYYKKGKANHPDVPVLLGYFDNLVTKKSIPIKYRPDKPFPGMITIAEMGKILQTGDTWHESDSKKFKDYLQGEMDKAKAAGNADLYNELAGFYELAAGFKVPRVTAKDVAKAVLTGGLSEETGRKIVSSITTGGLVNTKVGQKVAEKVGNLAEKVERKGDVLAAKAGQLFKTVNLALPRSAFLSLALINIFGICTHLQDIKEAGEKGNADAAAKWNKVRNFWYKIGGNRAKFDKAIKNGSKKKPFLAKIKNLAKADGAKGMELYLTGNDIGYMYPVGVDDAGIAVWVGLATSVIAAITKIAGKPKDMDAESGAAIDAEAAANQAQFDAAAAAEAANTTPEFLRDFSSGAGGVSGWGWVAIGVGTIIVGALTIRAIKRARS